MVRDSAGRFVKASGIRFFMMRYIDHHIEWHDLFGEPGAVALIRYSGLSRHVY